MTRKFFPIVLFFLVIHTTTLFAQSSTVHFYRLKSLYMANTSCIIQVNDKDKFEITNGSYYTLRTDSSSINMITSVNNTGIKNLSLEKGKTYYIEVTQSLNSVALALKDEFSGKPAIERLEADKKAKEMGTGNLKTVKVTTVAPIPYSNPEVATIYLFRPFNVAGLNLTIKVSDGEFLYEMKNNSSYAITTGPKEITFISVNEGSNTSNGSVKLKVEKGKVYYVAVLRTGGAIVLSETKEEYAKKEMKLQ